MSPSECSLLRLLEGCRLAAATSWNILSRLHALVDFCLAAISLGSYQLFLETAISATSGDHNWILLIPLAYLSTRASARLQPRLCHDHQNCSSFGNLLLDHLNAQKTHVQPLTLSTATHQIWVLTPFSSPSSPSVVWCFATKRVYTVHGWDFLLQWY